MRRLRRSGRDDVTLTETSQRGVFAGAVRPFLGPPDAPYDSTLVTATTSRFLVTFVRAGHGVCVDEPEKFNRELLKFVG